MKHKLLRTIIGLPFVLVLFAFAMIVCMPIIMITNYIFEGNFEESKIMYDCCPFFPTVFLKKVWKDEN